MEKREKGGEQLMTWMVVRLTTMRWRPGRAQPGTVALAGGGCSHWRPERGIWREE